MENQDEDLIEFREGMEELGWTPVQLSKRLILLGDGRSRAAIIRSINRANEEETKVSGELAAFVKLQVRHMRLLNQIYGHLHWKKTGDAEVLKVGEYTLIVDPRKNKWAVSVTHSGGRSETWPNHQETIQAAKNAALLMLDDCMDFIGKLKKRRAT